MTELVAPVRHMILRELDAMKREILAYPDDASPWAMPAGVKNSGGNLALHCAGNLQHFIGARLGRTGYVRDRDAEFSKKHLSRADIVAELARAEAAVAETLAKITDETLPERYVEAFGGKDVNSDMMLVHLAVHVAYHLGQVDYHRRLVTGDPTTVDAVSAPALPPVR